MSLELQTLSYYIINRTFVPQSHLRAPCLVVGIYVIQTLTTGKSVQKEAPHLIIFVHL